jgi:hypothetical protein
VADFRRDQPVSKPKLGDRLWMISHLFPKWLYGLVVLLGLFIGLALASWFNLGDAYTASVVAAVVSCTCFVVTFEIDRRLLQRRTRLSAAVDLDADRSDDSPISFGYKICWIGVPSHDGHAFAESLGLEGIGHCSWRDGLEKAYNLRGVFVTPPIAGWTIAVGALPDVEQSRFLPIMELLSKTFHRAFYFGTHRVVEYQAWANAEEGRIRRGFAWLGERGEFLLNVGERTPEEVELGTGLEDVERPPNEETVLDLASHWVLDPRVLETRHSEARGPGWFGSLAKL